MGRAYYILREGRLVRKENTLHFEGEDVKKSIPLEDIEELFIMTNLSITTKVLSLLAKNGVITHLFNRYGYYVGSFYPRETHVSGHLLIKQAEHYLDREKRLYLAKAFVIGSIQNLSYVYKLEAEKYFKQLEKAESIEEVMNVEAGFRKLCYEKLEEISGFDFGKRTKRPPQNMLNALISFGNSLVYAKVLGEIYYTPLNPTISYLHEPSTKRFSLSLDIAEIFKPILSDKLILDLIKREKITEKHFRKELNASYLNEEGKRVFLSEFDNLLNKTIKHPNSGERFPIKH
ncbi:type I-B CRISPR-associated endonuclease Cas1b [Aquifex pyrophilus]